MLQFTSKCVYATINRLLYEHTYIHCTYIPPFSERACVKPEFGPVSSDGATGGGNTLQAEALWTTTQSIFLKVHTGTHCYSSHGLMKYIMDNQLTTTAVAATNAVEIQGIFIKSLKHYCIACRRLYTAYGPD